MLLRKQTNKKTEQDRKRIYTYLPGKGIRRAFFFEGEEPWQPLLPNCKMWGNSAKIQNVAGGKGFSAKGLFRFVGIKERH